LQVSVKKPRKMSRKAIIRRNLAKDFKEQQIKYATKIEFKKAHFYKLVNTILESHTKVTFGEGETKRFMATKEARAALMEASQHYLINWFRKLCRTAYFGRRVTIMVKDSKLLIDLDDVEYAPDVKRSNFTEQAKKLAWNWPY